jgi:hypothetical protein
MPSVIGTSPLDVRFALKSGHFVDRIKCPLCAISGLVARFRPREHPLGLDSTRSGSRSKDQIGNNFHCGALFWIVLQRALP